VQVTKTGDSGYNCRDIYHCRGNQTFKRHAFCNSAPAKLVQVTKTGDSGYNCRDIYHCRGNQTFKRHAFCNSAPAELEQVTNTDDKYRDIYHCHGNQTAQKACLLQLGAFRIGASNKQRHPRVAIAAISTIAGATIPFKRLAFCNSAPAALEQVTNMQASNKHLPHRVASAGMPLQSQSNRSKG